MSRYAFYTGCVSKGACPELYQSTVAVAKRIGIELVEMQDVGCNGAGVLTTEISDPINARTLAKAEQMGLPIMTICSTCQGVIGAARLRLMNESYRSLINERFLREEGLEYKGTTVVKHFLWILVEEVGMEPLQGLVTNPLTDVGVSPFYGCYMRRPDDVIEQGGRKRYLEQIITGMGATNVDISGKGKCCGFPIASADEANSLAMAAKHTGEAKGKGADAMVVPCPLCHLNLDGQQERAAAATKKELDIPVFHLPQLIGLALGIDPRELGIQRNIVSAAPVLNKLNRAKQPA